MQRRSYVSDDRFEPKNLPQPWVFTQALTLPEGQLTVPVLVRIWDDDDTLNFADDRMDISPQNQDVELNLTYNILTETWSGDGIEHGVGVDVPCFDHDGIALGQACAVGDGDPNYPEDGDGKRAELGLTITGGDYSDADSDGLSDRDERYGVRNKDNSIAVDLPRFGANPLHKDLFLELDYTAGRAPSRLAVEAVKRAFALAPLPNPVGGNGLTMHVDSGGLHDKTAMEGPPAFTCTDGVDNDGKGGRDGADVDCRYRDVGVEDLVSTCDDNADNDHDNLADEQDPDCVVGENLGGGNALASLNNCGLDQRFTDTKGAPGNNFAVARQRVFNYVIFTTKGPKPDGTPCRMGGQGGGTDIILYRADGGALMHELGHNLGLHHGGFEGHNCKPNYLSLMNYDINSGIPRAGGGLLLDYSPARIALDGSKRGKAPLDQLNEDDLRENRVQDPADNLNTFVFLDGAGKKRKTPLNANPDWNGDNPIGFGDDGDLKVVANIDGSPPDDCKNATKDGELKGHDDWRAVQEYLPHRFPAPGDTVTVEPETFPDEQEAELIIAGYNTTDLGVTVADTPDPVAAGESLMWTLAVFNYGPNPSTSTQITTTLPLDVTNPTTNAPCEIAAATVICNVDEVGPGATKQLTITADVPADLVYRNGGPKTVTATATVDNLAGPDPVAANDSATAQTTVIAKADVKITQVVATAPLEVLIGEPGTASVDLTVENGGPSSPVDTTVTTMATADAGITITPATSTSQQTALAVGAPRHVTYTATVQCTAPGTRTVSLSSTIALAHGEDVDPDPTNNTRSATFRIDCVVPIAINVRPHGFPNSINLNTDATVAALTTMAGEYGLPLDFDATAIDVSRTMWGLRANLFNTANPQGGQETHGVGHPERSYELDERTRDADTDLILHFKPADSGLTLGSTQACLKGTYLAPDGNVYTFLGCDSVRVMN